MKIYRSNLNYKERIAAEKYLLGIYPDANKFTLGTKYIRDQIDNFPTKESRDNDIKSIKKRRDNLYDESKSVEIETKPSKPINSGISNKKVYSSKPDNFNIPYKFETEPQQSINEQNINNIRLQNLIEQLNIEKEKEIFII